VRRWIPTTALVALLFLMPQPLPVSATSDAAGVELTEARLDDKGLEATYRLRNLFLEPSRDVGALKLRSNIPLRHLLESGGTLMGSAHSTITGRRHAVHGLVRPDGSLRLDFQLGHRLVTFETRYRGGSSKPGGDASD
jgi:hypothetical protein